MISAIIVDDEHLARAELKKQLLEHSDIEVIAEMSGVTECIDKINSDKPDIVFLDIPMLEKAGFNKLLDLEKPPRVVFTTNYDEYGLKAFEINALDYLLKPIGPTRLAHTMDKVRAYVCQENASHNGFSHQASLTDADHVFVKDGEHCWFLKLSEVRLFESIGNYTKLFFGDNKPLILKSLSALEEKLDCRMFFRANRKNIINLRWVKNIEPYFNGGLLLELKGGEKIEISRRQATRFKETMSL